MTRRVYTPRPFAALAMAHFANVPRGALFAKPGMGKTTMVLTFLDHLHNVCGEDRPTLVLGPKRVAQHVWPDEVRKWEHLRGLDVVSVTGSAAERASALLLPAQVYATNYDNLVWLRDHYKRAGRAWPFATIVADESTRLKSFRLRQGGVRAQALGEFAHRDVERWINLTGTPAPNGLVDLWGQTWFLDAGARLGRSFSSFQDRYFAWKNAADAFKKGKGGALRFDGDLKELVGHIAEISQELKVFNTVCPVTIKRQNAATELAGESDVIVVVGGKNSANTRELVNLARMQGKTAYHIEHSTELEPAWLEGIDRVGLIGGCSTPMETLLEVKERAEALAG